MNLFFFSKAEAIGVSVALALKYNKVFTSSLTGGDKGLLLATEAWTKVMFYPYAASCCPLQASICNSSSLIVCTWILHLCFTINTISYLFHHTIAVFFSYLYEGRFQKFSCVTEKKKKSPQALAAPSLPPLNQSGYHIDAPQFCEMDNRAKMLLIPRVLVMCELACYVILKKMLHKPVCDITRLK